MAKFDAGTAVEKLEYDFSAFGGGIGDIQEPTTGQVSYFFKEMKKMIKEVRALTKGAGEADDSEMSDEEMAEHIAKMDENAKGAEQYQEQSVELIAELCGAKWVDKPNVDQPSEGPEVIHQVLEGGAPSLAELQALPHRHLQAFSTWLIAEISPKKGTPGTKN